MDKDLPLVTIGIPTYNRANSFFRESLACAVSQNYPNLEIVVSDNCSDDGTKDLVRSCIDQRIKYFKQKQKISVQENFNFCLEQASGQYFLLLHDDDLIDRDFVTSCIEAAAGKQEIGVVRTGIRIIDNQGKILHEEKSNAQGLSPLEFFLAWFGYIKKRVPIYCCNTLFNARRLKEIGGFHSRTNLYLDVAAIAKLVVRYGHVDISEIKASYRKQYGRTTYGKKAMIADWCTDSHYLLDVICDSINNNTSILRSNGMKYMSKTCYTRTGRIESMPERIRTYIMVYRNFGYCYSPFRHFYYRIGKRIERDLKPFRHIRKA